MSVHSQDNGDHWTLCCAEDCVNQILEFCIEKGYIDRAGPRPAPGYIPVQAIILRHLKESIPETRAKEPKEYRIEIEERVGDLVCQFEDQISTWPKWKVDALASVFEKESE